MPKLAVRKAFLSRQRRRPVAACDLVEYTFVGMYVHLLIPGVTPVVMTRREFSDKLADGTLGLVPVAS